MTCVGRGGMSGGGGGIDTGSKAVLVCPRASVALRFFWNWVEMTGPYILDVGHPGRAVTSREVISADEVTPKNRQLTKLSFFDKDQFSSDPGSHLPSSTLLREQLIQTLSDPPSSRKEVQFLILQLLWQSSHLPLAICFSQVAPNPHC